MTRSFRLLAAFATVGVSGGLTAQEAPKSAPANAAEPRLTVLGSSTASWPGLSLATNEDAYITVFAVARTRGAALPVQVLSPKRPNDTGLIAAGKTVTPRKLLANEVTHLLSYGESPLIVAFASREKPDLSAFQAGGRWGQDLLIDTVAGSDRQVVQIIGKTIFAPGVPFDAISSDGSLGAAGATSMGSYAVGNRPRAVSGSGQSGDGVIVERIDPLLEDWGQIPGFGVFPNLMTNSGMPITLKGGSRVSITSAIGGPGSRLAYWPPADKPPTAEQKAAQAGADKPTTPPPGK